MFSKIEPTFLAPLSLFDYQLIALILSLVCGSSFICNCIVAFYTNTLPSMKNPFGKLTTCQSTASAIISGLFIFYVVPMIVMKNDKMQEYSEHVGFICIVCYDVVAWAHLFISFNRFAVFAFNKKYELYFSQRNTKILMLLTWMIPGVTATVLFQILPCRANFDDYYFGFIFQDTPTCYFIAHYLDCFKCLSIILTVSSLDMATLWKVRKTTKMLNLQSEQQKQRRRVEINFVKQTVLQGLIFSIEIIFYFFIAWEFENRYIVFALTTLMWQTLHLVDALIIITFNKEFRVLVVNPFIRLSTQISKSRQTSST